MSGNPDIQVRYCVLEYTPAKEAKESKIVNTSAFLFQSSECRMKTYLGWETNDERKVKIYVNSKPTLSPNFYATMSIFNGKHLLSYPKKQVQDPLKYIWSLSISDLAKQLPGNFFDFKFRFVFQQEAEPDCDQKMNDHKFVQTSVGVSENHSVEKLCEEKLCVCVACECLALANDENFRDRVVGFILKNDIPFNDEKWKPFCEQHPSLAIDVLNKLVSKLRQHGS